MSTAEPTSPPGPYPPKSEISVAAGFALMLETACNDFEILQRLIRRETRLVSANSREEVMDAARVQMALAKSFVFYTVRARRICEHGAGSLKIDRAERKSFIDDTEDVLKVRDVNEHGFDVGGAVRGKVSKPSAHHHPNEGAILDETSLFMQGDQKILMGPVNLYTIYVPTVRMRQLAGFRSLRPTLE